MVGLIKLKQFFKELGHYLEREIKDSILNNSKKLRNKPLINYQKRKIQRKFIKDNIMPQTDQLMKKRKEMIHTKLTSNLNKSDPNLMK